MDKAPIRYYIFTRFKLDFNATQIHTDSCTAWGDGYVSYTTVAEWLYCFKQGRISLEGDPRIDQPVTEATDQNIEVIRALIDENPHISIRYVVFETGLSYVNINRIIHDELKLKKLCARWVAHHLTEKRKQQRMEICQENLAKLKSNQ